MFWDRPSSGERGRRAGSASWRGTHARGLRAGFTLIELMVVVTIIAIAAALAAPGMSRAMADRRASEATRSVVVMGGRARAEAQAYGRAHVLRYVSTSSNGSDGTVELWRGRVDRCSMNSWADIMDNACTSDEDCLERADMGMYAFGSHRVQMAMVGATAADLCFQPNGDMYVSVSGGLFTTTSPSGTDGIRLTFTRLESGSNAGVQRAVVFPFGGPPRVIR